MSRYTLIITNRTLVDIPHVNQDVHPRETRTGANLAGRLGRISTMILTHSLKLNQLQLFFSRPTQATLDAQKYLKSLHQLSNGLDQDEKVIGDHWCSADILDMK